MHRLRLTTFQKKYWTDTGLFMTVGVLLAWGLACGLTALAPLSARPDQWQLLLRAVLVMAACRLVFSHKYSVAAGGTLLLIACGVTAADYLLHPADEQFVRLREFLSAVSGFLRGEQAAPDALWNVVHWACLLLLGLFLSVFMLTTFRFTVIAIASAAIIGLELFLGAPVALLPFTAVTGCLMVLYVRRCAATKADRNRSAVIALTVIPPVLLCSAAAVWIPTPSVRLSNLPISGILKQQLDAVGDTVYAWSNPPGFSLEAAGYPVRLGGDIELSDEPLLEVQSADSGLYLSGADYDHYTGYSWVDTAADAPTAALPFSDRCADMLERISSNAIFSFIDSNEFEYIMSCMEDVSRLADSPYQIKAGDPQADRVFIKMHLYPFKAQMASITVRQRQYALLKPPLTVGMAVGQSSPAYLADEAGNLLSGKLLTDGDTYSLTYRGDPDVPYWSGIYLNSRRGILRDMQKYIGELRGTYTYDREQISVNWSTDYQIGDLNVFVGVNSGETGFDANTEIAYEELLANTLIPRADAIYSRYTALPAVYPQRVKEPAEAIADGAISDYRKVENIRQYLRQFPYTLSPGPVPADRDFVDYFLFDAKKGYCTYYASAFVVLCRAVGLPARFVEGFSTENATSEDGRRIITGENAHAWPEVYFEGYGWMTFEPTGSENARRESGPLGDLYDRHMAGAFDELGADFRPDDYRPDAGDTPDINGTGRAVLQRVASVLAVSFGVFLIGLAARPAWVWLVRRRRASIWRRMGDREAVLCTARDIYRLLKAYRLTMENGETARSFICRAAILSPFDSAAADMRMTLDVYTRARYGGFLQAGDRHILEQAAASVETVVKRDAGRLRFWIWRYILGRV